jgi:hypothetical protein
MKPLRLALTALVAAIPALVAGAAAAQAPSEDEVQARLAKSYFARGGYYLGAEGLVAVENSALIGVDTHIVSGGLDIRLGLRHNRWFASEISGLYIHTYGDGTGQFLAWGMAINERFYFTERRLQPFVTVGLGFLQVRSRDFTVDPFDGSQGFDPGFAPSFGLGMEIYATEDFAVTVMGNYYLTVGNISGFDFVTAGIGFVYF